MHIGTNAKTDSKREDRETLQDEFKAVAQQELKLPDSFIQIPANKRNSGFLPGAPSSKDPKDGFKLLVRSRGSPVSPVEKSFTHVTEK